MFHVLCKSISLIVKKAFCNQAYECAGLQRSACRLWRFRDCSEVVELHCSKPGGTSGQQLCRVQCTTTFTEPWTHYTKGMPSSLPDYFMSDLIFPPLKHMCKCFIYNDLTWTIDSLPLKCLGSFLMFLKEASSAHQGCNYKIQ